jgi:hypothetical protein
MYQYTLALTGIVGGVSNDTMLRVNATSEASARIVARSVARALGYEDIAVRITSRSDTPTSSPDAL